ncbi:MAG: carbohydrate kinase family protein [Clostridia bacterium]|nr:carbohydrate kinase family protein [Clostridia bacterium]
MREGIAFAGNLIVDRIRKIDRLPKRSELAAIRSVGRSTGGACNNAIGMTKLAPDLPVSIHGVVGLDGEGDYILSELSQCGVDTNSVVRRGETSFTDAYLESETACRTFFHFGGANDTFDVSDVPIDAINARLFHIVYPLLLKTLDSEDPQYGTRMARLLHDLRQAGILTSLDVVSEDSDRYQKIVCPALHYTDYLTVNELEAARITGIPLSREDGSLIEENIPLALARLFELGVSRWAIIHAPSAAFGMDSGRCFARESGKLLPPGFISGTVGAGDAFCTGVLLAAYRGLSIGEALRYGNASAIQSLKADTPNGSMLSIEASLAQYDLLPSRA